jgi:hypothetical protein
MNFRDDCILKFRVRLEGMDTLFRNSLTEEKIKIWSLQFLNKSQ